MCADGWASVVKEAEGSGPAGGRLRLEHRGVFDELGYLPLDQSSANWIFQVVSRRYEKSSPIVLTSNRGFSDWGQVFADQVVATAIVDRLIDNAIVINIRGRSFRTRGHQDSSNGKSGR